MAEQKWFIDDADKRLPEFPDKEFDLLLTDPPFGMQTVQRSGRLRDLGYDNIKNDDKVIDLKESLRVTKNQIVFGGNFFNLPRSRGWIAWDKRGTKQIGFGDCELIWTSFDMPTRIIKHLWDGFIKDSEHGEPRVHPCQKPVKLMVKIINMLTKAGFIKPGDTILDPYLGSGSTLEACMATGHSCMGFEIDPQWVPVYEKRLRVGNRRLDEYLGLNGHEQEAVKSLITLSPGAMVV